MCSGVTLDPDNAYRALTARDARFDGVFFVGVTTTGIYCRPVCPARTPAAPRCRFFKLAVEAERAGFRACFRCRPELAPGNAMVDSIPRLVRAASARIDAGYLNEHSVDELAASLGVSDRHLRRAMEAELGVVPVELAQARRLALAKQLLHDTTLPVTEVALAAGFQSLRRFNASFKERFNRSPSAVRRQHGDGTDSETINLRADYRAPFAWDTLLGFLRGRAIPGVELVDEDSYRRTVVFGNRIGQLELRNDAERNAVRVSVSMSLAPKIAEIMSRVRALLDLDARPDVIASHLKRERLLAKRVAAQPGLRVPGAFDGFEMMMRAILGQQVSVRGATTLSGRLVQKFGAPSRLSAPGLSAVFPSPGAIAEASVDSIASLGLPGARARTLKAVATAVAEGKIELAPGTDPEKTIALLQELPGIGPWTAQYVAMRALRWPDAYPAGDLGIFKALGVKNARASEERAAAWRPWRAYATMHLWSSL